MKTAVFITHTEAASLLYKNTLPEGAYGYPRDRELEPCAGQLLFYRPFALPEGAKAARINATALGVFELYVNGQRVGTKTDSGMVYDELKPEWTEYEARLMEYEYDILPFCREGDNTLVVTVSSGWWGGRISFGKYPDNICAFCGEIAVTDAKGKTTVDATAPGWKTALGGRVRTAEIWDGEYYDAREADPAANPEAYAWTEAVRSDRFRGEFVPLTGSPLRVLPAYERHALSATLTEGVEKDETTFGKVHILYVREGENCERGILLPGQHLILDMGQNMVGRPALTIRDAQSGTKIQIRTAEFLNDSGERSRGNDGPRGSAYLENYRSALSRFTYVAAGEGVESCTPLATYYGFRYLDVETSAPVQIESLRGEVVSSSVPETGDVETDNENVNKLISNVKWGMRGNYFSNPTDCPQRDERLGWTGDTQIFSGAGAYLGNTRAFMHKWLGDVRACQLANGGKVGDVIPFVLRGNNFNNAAWADVTIIVPLKMWMMYHDDALLAEHFEAMDDYMTSLEANGLEGPNTAYGDWLNYDDTDNRYIAVCYYAYDAMLMEQFAQILMRSETKYQDKVVHYHLLRKRILEHYRKRYIEDGKLLQDTQTGYLLALAFDMVDGDLAEQFRTRLRQKIVENGYRLSTGFVGTGVLNQTLAKCRMDDLAYDLLLQDDDPSWLYSVKQGATTIWERWNSYTLKKGFGDVGMNSFNHYAYGAVVEWMFANMAGIAPDPAAPGFEETFLLAPRPDFRKGELLPAGQRPIRHVKAHLDVEKGRIESEWQYDGDKNLLTYCCTIPAGLSAGVCFPAGEGADTILLNGKKMTAAALDARVAAGEGWYFTLPAGRYEIKG